MPDIRTFLGRFRPAGAPGAAAAVPADRRTTLAPELEPVFALLDDAGEECRRLLDEAAVRARSWTRPVPLPEHQHAGEERAGHGCDETVRTPVMRVDGAE